LENRNEHTKTGSLPNTLVQLMSGAARSSLAYGIYGVLSGAALLVKPNFALRLYGTPPDCQGWVRMLGMFLFVLGIYYIVAARREMVEYFELSVFGRFSVTVFMTIFVLLGFVPRIGILLGVIDLFFGTWTLIALQRNSTAQT
jgi:hypothetical protein